MIYQVTDMNMKPMEGFWRIGVHQRKFLKLIFVQNPCTGQQNPFTTIVRKRNFGFEHNTGYIVASFSHGDKLEPT